MIKQGCCKGRQQDESSDVWSSSDSLGQKPAGASCCWGKRRKRSTGRVSGPMMQAALDGRLQQVHPLQPQGFRPQSFSSVKRGGTWMCTADDHRRAVKVCCASELDFFLQWLFSITAKEASDGSGFRVCHVTGHKNLTDKRLKKSLKRIPWIEKENQSF